jgi:hypothetical protein
MVIHENQDAFIKNKQITNNIILAFRAFHSLHTSSSRTNPIVPLNYMSKAFDRVEKDYFKAVLLAMNFPGFFATLIMRYVRTVYYPLSR